LATTNPHSGLSPPSYLPCTAHNKKPEGKPYRFFYESQLPVL
jgi:hypothetical protein